MAAISAFKIMNIPKDFEDVFKVKDITSDDMKKAIKLWRDVYYSFEDKKYDDSQRIPYLIVDGLCKSIFGEHKCTVDETKPSEKQIKIALKKFNKMRNKAFQKACIGGEIFIKPIIKRDNFAFSIVSRENIKVLARDVEGNIADLVTCELTIKGVENHPIYYWLLERRTLDVDGYLTIENKLYKSSDKDSIGTFTSLNSLPEYKDLQDKFILPTPLYSLGLIPITMPMENCVDGSFGGVSIYAAAIKEILKLYKHENRTQKEFDFSEPHIIADVDLQSRDRNGNFIEIPPYITPLEFSKDKTDLTLWNPKPNQQELEQREDQIKRSIEDLISLRRGFLSKSTVQEFTATEIISTTSKMAHLISDLQEMWEGVIVETVRVCTLLAEIYKLSGWVKSEPLEPIIEWGDGVLYDEDKEFNRLSTMTAQNELKPEIQVGWFFGMPYETDEEIKAIREKYMTKSDNDNNDKDDDESLDI